MYVRARTCVCVACPVCCRAECDLFDAAVVVVVVVVWLLPPSSSSSLFDILTREGKKNATPDN